MSRDIMMQSSICLNFTLRNVIIVVIVDIVWLKFPSLDGASLHKFRSGLLYIYIYVWGRVSFAPFSHARCIAADRRLIELIKPLSLSL